MTRLRLALIVCLLVAGCSKKPTEPDRRAPTVAWATPDPASVGDDHVVDEDTITVEFTASDDGGVVSSVTVYLGGAPVATLTTAPYRTRLDLTGIDKNRSAPAFATAADPDGNVGSTADTLNLVYSPPPDTARWTPLTPSPLPPPREGHTLVLDAGHDRAILFGGFSGTTFTHLNDLWEYDLSLSSWRRLSVVDDTLITPRSHHGAAVIGDSLLVFGGETGAAETLIQDYFMLDMATGTWSLTILPGLPASRLPAVTHHGIVYAYGGREPGGMTDPAAVSNRLREYDAMQATWSGATFDVSPSPQRRVSAALAVDAEGGRLFVFGGITTVLRDPPSDSNWYLAALPPGVAWQTRAYVPDTVRTVPPPLQGTCAIYDSLENRILLWGGEDNTGAYPDDLWEFSLGAKLWRRVPTTTTGPPPSGRAAHQMVMDAPNRRILMFGGRGASGVGTDEMWELDLDPGP
jgi:hypothetical protein